LWLTKGSITKKIGGFGLMHMRILLLIVLSLAVAEASFGTTLY